MMPPGDHVWTDYKTNTTGRRKNKQMEVVKTLMSIESGRSMEKISFQHSSIRLYSLTSSAGHYGNKAGDQDEAAMIRCVGKEEIFA